MTESQALTRSSLSYPIWDKSDSIFQQWRAGKLPFEQAIDRLQALLREARTTQHIENQGHAHHALGSIYHYTGDLDASTRHNDKARDCFERIDLPQLVATIHLNQGENHRTRGEFQHAITCYRKTRQIARAEKNTILETLAIINEGLVLATVGEHETARKLLHDGYEMTGSWACEPETRNLARCEIHYTLAHIYLQQENIKAAWEQSKAAMATAREIKQPLQIGFANRTMAAVLGVLNVPPDDDFESDPGVYFEAALGAFRQVNAGAEIGRTLLRQGRWLAERGDHDRARDKLKEALAIFERLGMAEAAERAARLRDDYLTRQ